jgi:hypothetical protein
VKPSLETTTVATATETTPIADRRLLWYARLETAIERGDNHTAKEAIKNLERLGVEVRFLLPPTQVTVEVLP